MTFLRFLPLCLLLTACQSPDPGEKAAAENEVAPATPVETSPPRDTREAPPDIKRSAVRINATQQTWSAAQPWEKEASSQRRALGAIVAGQRVLTTAELVSDSTYLEFESPDATRFAEAKVVAVDYEANLALLALSDEEADAGFFADTIPLEISESPGIGETLEILQVESNGVSLLTAGALQSVDLTQSLLAGHSFLTFFVKASMQSAASSYSLPILREGKLAGVLLSYNSKDQICDVAATDLVRRFVSEAADGSYQGFPSLGVAVATTEDPSFREWLRLPADAGGLYIHRVKPRGAADAAGLKPGDVILSIDGHPIDRRGYYEHPNYGALSWGHLVRGSKSVNDAVTIAVQRDGQPLEIQATLTREAMENDLVPENRFDKAPNYFVKGGLIFQELTRTLLESFGEDWTSRAPLNLLDAYENPEKYQDRADRIVFLSGTIATPATLGYEPLRNLIVRKVNGKEVRDMKSLVAAFKSNLGELHSIEFDEENFTVYLDEALSTAVDQQLLQRGLTRLSRTE